MITPQTGTVGPGIVPCSTEISDLEYEQIKEELSVKRTSRGFLWFNFSEFLVIILTIMYTLSVLKRMDTTNPIDLHSVEGFKRITQEISTLEDYTKLCAIMETLAIAYDNKGFECPASLTSSIPTLSSTLELDVKLWSERYSAALLDTFSILTAQEDKIKADMRQQELDLSSQLSVYLNELAFAGSPMEVCAITARMAVTYDMPHLVCEANTFGKRGDDWTDAWSVWSEDLTTTTSALIAADRNGELNKLKQAARTPVSRSDKSFAKHSNSFSEQGSKGKELAIQEDSSDGLVPSEQASRELPQLASNAVEYTTKRDTVESELSNKLLAYLQELSGANSPIEICVISKRMAETYDMQHLNCEHEILHHDGEDWVKIWTSWSSNLAVTIDALIAADHDQDIVNLMKLSKSHANPTESHSDFNPKEIIEQSSIKEYKSSAPNFTEITSSKSYRDFHSVSSHSQCTNRQMWIAIIKQPLCVTTDSAIQFEDDAQDYYNHHIGNQFLKHAQEITRRAFGSRGKVLLYVDKHKDDNKIYKRFALHSKMKAIPVKFVLTTKPRAQTFIKYSKGNTENNGILGHLPNPHIAAKKLRIS